LRLENTQCDQIGRFGPLLSAFLFGPNWVILKVPFGQKLGDNINSKRICPKSPHLGNFLGNFRARFGRLSLQTSVRTAETLEPTPTLNKSQNAEWLIRRKLTRELIYARLKFAGWDWLDAVT